MRCGTASYTSLFAPITGSMHHESESVTISLDRPRKLILFFLYGVACFVVSLALAALALMAVSRYA